MDSPAVILTKFAMLAFLLAGMLELGLSLTPAQVLGPLRNARLVAGALVANFLLAPLLAWGLARVAHLEEPFAAGLLLLGLAPGAPFIPRIVQLARGSQAFAVGLMVMLMVGTVVVLPLVLPHVVTGAEVQPWPIARSLLLLMLLPLFTGLFANTRFRSLPTWLRPMLRRISDIGGLVLLVLIVALNFRGVLGVFGTGAILVGAVFVGLSTLIGRLLGGRTPETRDVLALGTGSRNFGAALVVGAQSFKDPRVNVMVVVSALVTLAVLAPTARAWGRRAGERSGTPPTANRKETPE